MISILLAKGNALESLSQKCVLSWFSSVPTMAHTFSLEGEKTEHKVVKGDRSFTWIRGGLSFLTQK